jgi:hypothetical protein
MPSESTEPLFITDDACILVNPHTTRNCPYSIACAVCNEDTDEDATDE